MRKIISVMIILAGLIPTVLAQPSLERSVVASAGGSWYDGSSFEMDYTIGEVAVLTISNTGNILTQGFQQPFTNAVVFTEQATIEDIRITVYPNPATDIFNIRIENAVGLDIQCEITDMLGQLVMRRTPVNIYDQAVVLEFDISKLATGNYFIRICSGDRMLKTGKLIKINQ